MLVNDMPANGALSADRLFRFLENARKNFFGNVDKRNPLLHIDRKKSHSSRVNFVDGDCDCVFGAIYERKTARLKIESTLFQYYEFDDRDGDLSQPVWGDETVVQPQLILQESD